MASNNAAQDIAGKASAVDLDDVLDLDAVVDKSGRSEPALSASSDVDMTTAPGAKPKGKWYAPLLTTNVPFLLLAMFLSLLTLAAAQYIGGMRNAEQAEKAQLVNRMTSEAQNVVAQGRLATQGEPGAFDQLKRARDRFNEHLGDMGCLLYTSDAAEILLV